MNYIKKYQRFVEEFTSTTVKPDVKPGTIEKPGTAPGKPSPFRRDKPSTEPGTKANTETKPDVKPGTIEKPGTAPGKPSPFRRNKPSTEPGTKASAEDVADKFIQMMVDKGESVEKYIY